MSNQDTAQLNMLPSFGDSGRTLSETERKEMIRRKGLCQSCGLVKVTESSANLFRRKNKIISNVDVWEGICIRCNRGDVPDHVAVEWERRNNNDRTTISTQHSGRMLNTSRNNLSSRRRVAPRRIQSERMNQISLSSSSFSRRPVGRASSAGNHASFRGLAMSPDDTTPKHKLGEIPASLRVPKTPDTSSSRKLMASFGDSFGLSAFKSTTKNDIAAILASFKKHSVAAVQEALQSLRSQIVYDGFEGMECIPYLEEILMPGASVSSVQRAAGQVLWILASANALDASEFFSPSATTMDQVVYAFSSCVDIPDASVACILHSFRPETLEWGARCLHRHVRLIDEFSNENSYKFVSVMMDESVRGSAALLWAGQLILTLFDHFEPPATLSDPNFLSFLLTVLHNEVILVSSTSHDLLATLMEVLTHIVESTEPELLRFDVERCCSLAVRAINELSGEDERVSWVAGRLLAVVFNVAKPRELLTISGSAAMQSLICAMSVHCKNPLFIAVAGHAFWKLSSIRDVITMAEARQVLSIISTVTESNRGKSDHRDLSLLLSAIVSNISTLSDATLADLPIDLLGDAITHHPSDPTVCDYAFRGLSRILCLHPDSFGCVLRNLGRPNIVVAFSVTPPRADADIVDMVNACTLSPLPDPLVTLLSQLIRRMGARLQYLRDEVRLKEVLHLTSSLAKGEKMKANPQIALIVRRLEKIVNDQQLLPILRADCCTVLRDLLVHSDASINLSNILSAVQHLSDCHATAIDITILSLLYAVASRSTPGESPQPTTSMFSLLVRILHKHNHVDAPYASEIFKLGSGACSALCSGSKVQVSTTDIGGIAESAYKVLESNKSDSDTIANFLSALLVFCEDSLVAVFESGTIVMVNDVMNDSHNHESIQEIGCAILAAVTAVESMDMFLIILQTDGLKALVGALEVHGNNPTVRSFATEALRRLSNLSAIVPELAALDTIQKIVKLLSQHEDDRNFCINAIQLLGNMVNCEEPFQNIPDAEALNVCFDILRSQSDSAQLFHDCLAYITLFDLEDLPTQGRHAWTTILFEALNSFLGYAPICVVSLELLNHLYNGNGGDRLPEMNVESVYNATLAVIDSPALAKAGLSLLGTLDVTSHNESKLFTLVIMVLYIFHENVEVTALALDLLQGGMTERNEWTGYEVDAVVGTLVNFADSFAIQRKSTSVLYLLWQNYQLLLKERSEQLVPLLALVHATFDDQDGGAMAETLLRGLR